MRSLVFKELSLVSFVRPQKARRVTFDRSLTVVKGPNRTGKSSLLKSIYYSLGAEPAIVHRNWLKAGICTLLRFSVDEVDYSVLRDGPDYAVFDARDRVIERFYEQDFEFSEFLAKLLGFDLKLVSSKGDIMLPSPGYIFAPFYIDQDAGWRRNWSGFRGLDSVSHWRADVAEYHLGMRVGRFYELKAQSIRLHDQIKEVQARRKAFREVHEKIDRRYSDADFDLDYAAYEQEIRALLAKCSSLRESGERFKERLATLQSKKLVVEGQLTIVDRVRAETAADYDFAARSLPDDLIECWTCGAQYENTLVERSGLARDEDRCDEILVGLRRELRAVERLIRIEEGKYRRNADEFREAADLLNAKRGEVRLADLIRRDSRKELRAAVRDDIEQEVAREAELARQICDCERSMSIQSEREHRGVILDEFLGTLRRFGRELGVAEHAWDSEKPRVDMPIAETGSAVPRALLAYYFAFLQTLSRHSTSVACPIVIDSPNQQDQTFENVQKILTFVQKHRPRSMQMILATAETHGVNFDGKIEGVGVENSLLDEGQFDDVAAHMRPFRAQMTALGR